MRHSPPHSLGWDEPCQVCRVAYGRHWVMEKAHRWAAPVARVQLADLWEV